VLNFLDPLSTADAEGLQVAQGWVAIAVGGPWGVGLGNGVAQQGFLPEAHTDMILAVIGEETGVFGMLAVLVLELVVIARGMGVAARAHDMFEMVGSACITAYLGAQVIINVAVVGGFAPPKGLVLPFVSYGASAMIFNIVAVAMLLRMGLEGHRARVKEQACSVERSKSSISSASVALG
jgi:cell division protein FtsW